MREDYLSKKYFLGLKGLLSFMVLLHHTYQFSEILAGTYYSYILLLLGRWAVYIFIFMTGYGLYSSYLANGDSYIKKFPYKRILPYYIVYLFFVALYLVFSLIYGHKIGASLIIKSLTFGGTIVSFGWYFQFALFIYISFWFAFSITSNPKIRSTIIMISLMLFVFFCFSVNFVYYIPVLTVSYIGGVHVSMHRQRLDTFLRKFSIPTTIISLFIFIISSILYISHSIRDIVIPFEIKEYIVALIMEISEITFCISLLYITSKTKNIILCNKITFHLGQISLETYALQGIILTTLHPHIHNPYLYAITSILATIIVATIIHIVFSKTIHKTVGKH